MLLVTNQLASRRRRSSPANACAWRAKYNALADFTLKRGMILVSDNQLRIVAGAAVLLPAEARGTFLRRVVAEVRGAGCTMASSVSRSSLSSSSE